MLVHIIGKFKLFIKKDYTMIDKISLKYTLVSICIPTYNNARFLRESLDSIVNQTYSNKEIIVSDNASTDETKKIVKEYVEKYKIKYYRNEKNIGGEANFTRCIELANGELIAIYHSDDIYDKEIITRQVEYLNGHLNSGAVSTLAYDIDEEGEVFNCRDIPSEINKGNNCEYNFEEIFKAVMKYGNFLVCPSFMVRANIYKTEIKKYRYDMFKTSSDLDVWFRILRKYNIGILPYNLMSYRHSKTQGSYQNRNRVNEFSDFFLVMEYYISKGWVIKKIHNINMYMEYYNFLKRRNELGRAIFILTKGNSQNIYNLTYKFFNIKILKIALTSFDRFKVFVFGILLCILSKIGLSKTLGMFLYKLYSKLRRLKFSMLIT